MLDPDIRITKQVEDSTYALDGTRTSHIRVEFFVGKHGPFVERVDRDGFTQDKRDAILTAFAREVRTP
ncbi:MAG: hypothetical protein AUI15_33820 [Actinobacteria bacterium 13_2_20CM_2_66_6]|nr:MAG: hypothetical protein AUI15_33820 [Actinobacteria bacterium 13_2_20CM_2_66_6]